ncbi:MAG: type ISP restriction/modification enzyme, partial [Polyangiaceae bacterium]
DLARLKRGEYRSSGIRTAIYRPFAKQHVYLDRQFNNRVYQLPRLFPTPAHRNVVICTTGVGNRIGFSALITDVIPDVHMADSNGASQCFPLYLYENDEGAKGRLFAEHPSAELVAGYRKESAITEAILAVFRAAYGSDVSSDDVFFYVYGVLHSSEYRARFANDLKKMLPRVPLTRESADFRRFSKAGRALADLHLKYESVEPYPLGEFCDVLKLDESKAYVVQKMNFGRRDKQIDRTTIIYNSHITLSGIPLEAYDYVVNGKSAIEWILERYQVSRDKDSGIVNDPNEWAREHGQPRYILDLLKRVVRVSVETMKIVTGLPSLNEREQYPQPPKSELRMVAETPPLTSWRN